MANEDFFEDDFVIILTIEGTEYEEVEVKVNNPNKSVGDQISTIVQVFELSKIDGGGNPIKYYLGRMSEGDAEELLDPEDEDGREMTLLDYNVQSGDRLHLVSQPIAG